MFACMLNIYI